MRRSTISPDTKKSNPRSHQLANTAAKKKERKKLRHEINIHIYK